MAAMERMELDVFSTETNQAVVQTPGRRFPGLVIQGDTLWNLHEWRRVSSPISVEEVGRSRKRRRSWTSCTAFLNITRRR